ncbi:Auxin-responsive protein SAUR50 [Heracleum sosnowskyi]|uniref:Auxin-responsive protein SAUR50 n=1 Tax=Heracleum sosnowskyi TaxID=360622 RepID=A0AAD8M1S0_9APIA|nr:Auxin-responsive protein SAUR50 [Heracleum sosnowskyi]
MAIKFLRSKSSGTKKNGIVKLKVVVEKLQKSLLLGKKSYDEDDVPQDVKEGHFAVIAEDENENKTRFVVPLSYLSHPTFLSLLEQAADEYGFDHGGALTIPCRPAHLQKILAQEMDKMLGLM